MAPAVASSGIQARFWSGPGAGAAAVLGDWPHFRDVCDGFPSTASGILGGGLAVATALSQAIAGTAPLPEALAQAQTRMNAAIPQ